MDIEQFLESTDSDKEYKYKMLVYGNYTFRDNLEADSLVVVMKNVIPYLTSKYSIHFTVIVPELIKSFTLPNVHQVVYPLPTYCNTMRAHFDASKFLQILDWKRKDFDIIYSHVPEHTAQIANVVYNNSDLQPKIIGYSHWYEVAENAPYAKTLFDQAILGTLEAEEFGVNSRWLKNLVLERAEKSFNKSVISKLDKIIQPHYLGVDTVRPRKKFEKKSVIFNHRDSAYTGWSWFVDQIDKIWEERQDFTVYSTLAKVDRPWNKKINTETRTEYLDMLGSIQFGVGCFQKYSAWSISVTDGLSVNTPYLLPDRLCYPEMVPSDYPYLYKTEEDFRNQFVHMLDNPPTYDTSGIAKNMLWENRIAEWFGGWDKVFDLKAIQKSTSIDDIVKFIKKHKRVTKKEILDEMGWGVQIKWNPYRNALRNNPNIILLKDGYEYRK